MTVLLIVLVIVAFAAVGTAAYVIGARGAPAPTREGGLNLVRLVGLFAGGV
jgi:hypothetical protein